MRPRWFGHVECLSCGAPTPLAGFLRRWILRVERIGYRSRAFVEPLEPGDLRTGSHGGGDLPERVIVRVEPLDSR